MKDTISRDDLTALKKVRTYSSRGKMVTELDGINVIDVWECQSSEEAKLFADRMNMRSVQSK